MKEKKENQNPSIKILVGYHKPAELLKDDILTPIHLGRVLATEASKDGSISRDDYEWMCKNMIGDDTGDNISHLNRYFCELTGIYWAWKNYDKLGNPDYIGFMHYRRHFIFDNNFTKSLQLNGDGYSYLFDALDKKYFQYISSIDFFREIKNYDLIIPKIFDCNFILDKIQEFKSCKEFLYSWNGNNHTGYNIVKLISSMQPRYSDFLNIIDKNTKYYPYNMFIMKREIYFNYVNFLFEIIFQVYDIMKNDLYMRTNIFNKREIAWLSEYISTLFFYSLQKENRIIGEKYVSCGINCFNIDSNIKKKNNISIGKLIRRILEKI